MFHQKPGKLKDVDAISAQQLKDKLDQSHDLTLINVLSEATYIDCHITGSMNIPFDRLIETVSSWEKDKEIVVYSAQTICPKSRQAYELLVDMGFTHAYEYQGGMREWIHKKFDATGICTMRYLHE